MEQEAHKLATAEHRATTAEQRAIAAVKRATEAEATLARLRAEILAKAVMKKLVA
jgi:hypothetical protein